MLNSILKVAGAQGLSKNEQKQINGGSGGFPLKLEECSISDSIHHCISGQGVFINGECCIFH